MTWSWDSARQRPTWGLKGAASAANSCFQGSLIVINISEVSYFANLLQPSNLQTWSPFSRSSASFVAVCDSPVLITSIRSFNVGFGMPNQDPEAGGSNNGRTARTTRQMRSTREVKWVISSRAHSLILLNSKQMEWKWPEYRKIFKSEKYLVALPLQISDIRVKMVRLGSLRWPSQGRDCKLVRFKQTPTPLLQNNQKWSNAWYKNSGEASTVRYLIVSRSALSRMLEDASCNGTADTSLIFN